jgi:hypothetical protein
VSDGAKLAELGAGVAGTALVAKLGPKLVETATGVAGGLVAGFLFKQLWRMATKDDHPPKATERERSWVEILAAAALQGAVLGVVRAAFHRARAVGTEQVTGSWPES